MAYIVVYQANDGSSGYEPTSDLDAAIQAAERLRNLDGVAEPRIFRTEEVHIDFRPYYRVEVTDESTVSNTVAASPVTEPDVAEPAAAPVEALAAMGEAAAVPAQPPYEPEPEPAQVTAPFEPLESVAPARPAAIPNATEVVSVDDLVPNDLAPNDLAPNDLVPNDEVGFDADGDTGPRRGLFGR